MQDQIINMAQQFGKATLESGQAFAGIQVQAADKLLRAQLDLINACLETGVKQCEALGKTEDPAGAIASQVEFSRTYAEKAMSAARETGEICAATGAELKSLLEDGTAAAAELVKVSQVDS